MGTQVFSDSFVQFFDINGFSKVYDHSGFLNSGQMVLKDAGGIQNCHWYHGDSALLGYLKAALMEGEEGVVFFVAGAFGKNAYGNSVFHFFHAGQYGFQSLFDIISVQKKAVDVLHPGI